MRDRGETARFEVRVFGEPTVFKSGARLQLSPKQVALVTLVFGHGARGLSRPRAAELLWRTDSDSAGRHRIRQVLLEIRQRGGRGLIDTRGDELLPGPNARSDLSAFEEALHRGSLCEAAALARQEFGGAKPASVSESFDDWRTARSIALLRSVRVRASLAWQAAFERREWRAAREAAEALYALHPEDPQVVERVIESRGHVGSFEAAESAFGAYLESLNPDEEPSSSIVQTIERVRRASVPGRGSPVDPPSELPFIGRDAALAKARTVLDAVESGRFEFVLIAGESGIGKTRLLQELRREAAFRDVRCLYAQPVELERGIPLNPLLDALTGIDLRPHLDALGRPWNTVIGSMLPAGALDEPPGEPPPIQESALPRRLLDAFALLFERLAEEQPTLLLIDDIQWADATTVTALQFVQRRWTRGALGIIASVRPELVDHDDPLTRYLSGSDGLAVQRIELGELSSAEGEELIEHVGQGEIPKETASRICALAGLHPLYLIELARDYLAGRLELPELSVDEVMIPVSLKQILDARLLHVRDEAMKLAGLLAVAGRPMRLADLAKLARVPVDDAADLVEELRRARLVEVENDRVRIMHELFRSAIYKHIGEPRRTINHRAVAGHLLAEAAEESAGALATHYAKAGDRELAARHGWGAAARAMASGAVVEAAHFYQLVTDNEADALRRAEATAGLALALHLTRDIGRANPQLELAASRLRAAGRPGEALRMEIRRVEGLAEVGAAPLTELLERLDVIKLEARERLDWEGVALALDAELHLLHREGNIEGIRTLFDEMREVAQRDSVEGALLSHAGLALGVLFDDPEEALRSARHALSLTTQGMSYRLRTLLRLMVVLQYRGMLALSSSREVVQEARTLAQRSGDLLQKFSIESNLASAALDAGDLERAELLMARSTAMLGAADMDLNRFNQANNRAELALARDEYRGAAAAFSEASGYLGPTTPDYMIDLVNAGLGLCALETGGLSEARHREEQLRDPPQSWYFDPTTILAFRARLLERRGRHEEAIALLDVHAGDLQDRLVLAGLKVRALQVRLMARRGDSAARGIAVSALERAARLELRHRCHEFSNLVAGLE